MRIALVYYSMCGNTEYIADRIKEKIESDLIRLVPKKEYPSKGFLKFFWGGKSAVMGESPALEDYEFDGDKYDLIIFASPVWASTFAPPLRTFINENSNKLKDKKFAIIMCQSGAGADKAISKLKEILNIKNFEKELVLIDPKDKKSEDKDRKIDEFCKNIV